MACEVEYSATALRQLRKLDRLTARRILDHLDEVAALDHPRSCGKGLVGDRAGSWRYRVGDYSVVCELRDAELVILALEVGHRSGSRRRPSTASRVAAFAIASASSSQTETGTRTGSATLPGLQVVAHRHAELGLERLSERTLRHLVARAEVDGAGEGDAGLSHRPG